MSLPAGHEEPISKKHDLKSFGCGAPSMNDFLQRYARQGHESGAAKAFLAIDTADKKTILRFNSLAPGALAYADTPETVRRGLSRYDVPGFRLARIATDLRGQGQGLGGQLLAAIARRCLPAAAEVGGAHYRCKERPRGPLVHQLRRSAFEQQASDACNAARHLRRRPESGRTVMTPGQGKGPRAIEDDMPWARPQFVHLSES